MSKDDSYEECYSLNRVIYYNSNGLVRYYITDYVRRTTINIPFEYFDDCMKTFLEIKPVRFDRCDANKIVNAEENKGASVVFFEDIQQIGNKYFLDLYNAVWRNVPVSHYKFLLPNIIDEFHGEIIECIKGYAKSLGIIKKVPENCYSVTRIRSN